MGAGAQPLTPPVEHAARVPGALPFDAGAAEAAARAVWRAGDGAATELAAWVAGCTGSVPPFVREHVVLGDAGAGAGVPLPSVGHVARAVDEGRDRAAAARAEGATVLVLAGAGDVAVVARVRAWLVGALDDAAVRGPLGALYRLGDEALALLCGVALGAGEHGLALLCDGAAGTAAGGLALAVQPDLRPRVRAVGAADDAGGAVLHARLGLRAVPGDGYAGAVSALRRACGE